MCVCGVVQRERESEHRRELDDGSFLKILTPLDRVSCLHACCRMVTDDALSVTGGVENPTVWSKEGTLLLSRVAAARYTYLRRWRPRQRVVVVLAIRMAVLVPIM